MKCKHCKKEIDEDSVFCTYCGKKVAKAEKVTKKRKKAVKKIKEKKETKEKKPFLETIKENKGKILTAVIIILALILVYLLVFGEKIPLDVDMEFSIFPGEYTSSFSIVTIIDSPLDDERMDALESLVSVMSRNDVPLTLFANARFEKKDHNELLSEETKLDIDNEKITEIDKKYNATIDIQSYGYADLKHAGIPYDSQEKLLRKARIAFKENGAVIKGFLPPQNAYNFDTVLAAENTNHDFMLVFGNDVKPIHPPSPLGGKMNILVFSVNNLNVLRRGNISGAFIMLVDITRIKNNTASLGSFFREVEKDKEVLTASLKQINDYIRKIEAMEATITTDYKKFETYIDLSNLVNNTKIRIRTALNPLSTMSVNQRNASLNKNISWWRQQDSYFFIINESYGNMRILWEKI